MQQLNVRNDILVRKLLLLPVRWSPLKLPGLLLVLWCSLGSTAIAQTENTCSAHEIIDADSAKMYAARQISIIQAHEDLNYLQTLLFYIHPDISRYTDYTSLTQSYQHIKSTLTHYPEDSITVDQFYRLTVPLMAQIRCGHTQYTLSKMWYRHHRFFPLRLEFISGNGYIVENFSCDSTLVYGTRVTHINNIPLSSITDSIMPYLMIDGYIQTAKWHMLQEGFPYYFGEFFGLADKFEITGVLPKDSVPIQIKLPASNTAYLAPRLEPPFSKKNPALQYKKIDETTAYLDVNSFNRADLNASKQNYKCYIKKVFRTLRRQNISYLVIDLRDNKGGDPAYTSFLYRYLAADTFSLFTKVCALSNDEERKVVHSIFEEYPDLIGLRDHLRYTKLKCDSAGFNIQLEMEESTEQFAPHKKTFTGKVYLLTDGGTFSSASAFTGLFKHQKRGMIVGTPTMSSATVMNGLYTPLIHLPNSNIRVNMPLASGYMASDEPFGYSVTPHHLIVPKASNLLQRQDEWLVLVSMIIFADRKSND